MGKGVDERVRLGRGAALCGERLRAGPRPGRGSPARAALRAPPSAVFVLGNWCGSRTGRPRPRRGRRGLFFPLPGGARGSLGVSMTTLCVWEGQLWGLPARAVPGRSFINVTHIMILSAASY